MDMDRLPSGLDARFPLDVQASIEPEISSVQHAAGHDEAEADFAEAGAIGGSPFKRRPQGAAFMPEDGELSSDQFGASMPPEGLWASGPSKMQRGASAVDLGRGVSPHRGTSPAKREDRLAPGELRGGDVHGGAGPAEAVTPEVPEFEVNEKVTYWSDTHGQHMSAKVTRINYDANGCVVSYDLDVKRNAQASKMRRAGNQEPSPQGAAGEDLSDKHEVMPAGRITPLGIARHAGGACAGQSAADGGPDEAWHAEPEQTPGNVDARAPESTPEKFAVHDKVEYWSDTFKQWMPAEVQRVRDDGITYDLDVKRGAQLRKMRPMPVPNQGESSRGAGDSGRGTGGDGIVVPAQTMKPAAGAAQAKQKPPPPSSEAQPLQSDRDRADKRPDTALGAGSEAAGDWHLPSTSAPCQAGQLPPPAGAGPAESQQPSLAAQAIEQFDQYGRSKAASAIPGSLSSAGGHTNNGAGSFLGRSAPASGVAAPLSQVNSRKWQGAAGDIVGPAGLCASSTSTDKGGSAYVRSSSLNSGSQSASSTAKATPPLAVGMVVQLEGLKASPQHNGMFAKLQTLDEASGRWTVRLTDGEVVSVKVVNLVPQDMTAQQFQQMQQEHNAAAAAAAAAIAAPPPAPAVHPMQAQPLNKPSHVAATPGSAPTAPPAQAAQVQPQAQQPQGSPPPHLPVRSRQAGTANAPPQGPWVVQPQAAPSPTAATPQPMQQQVPMASPHAAGGAPKALGAVMHGATPVHAAKASSPSMFVKVVEATPAQPQQAMQTPKQQCSRPAKLEVDELQMGSSPFDPKNASLHAQLTSKLHVNKNSSIEALQGFKGGLNEGVWILSDPSGASPDLVFKLVRCHRIAPTVLTEAENFLEIAKTYPSIMHDTSVAMPVKIFGCFAGDGQKRHDLIVMHKCPGCRFAEIIAQKWYGKQVPQLMAVFQKIGACLREYHNRYGNCQHGDFQPSNIFYDEESGQICLIDCGGMGVPTMETDVEHFAKSIRLLSEAYGQGLLQDGVRHFEDGYRGKR